MAFYGLDSWSFHNNFARNVVMFVLVVIYLLILIIARIIFQCQVKDPLMISMAILVQQRKRLVLILVKTRQNFAQVCTTTPTIVICLLMQNKSISLKQIIKMPSFQLRFVQESYLINLIKHLIKYKFQVKQKMQMYTFLI